MKNVISNPTGDVVKYIHDDESETIIKCTPSSEYVSDGLISVDKKKYTVIISVSKGCEQGCKMCGITGKFKYLEAVDVIKNVKEAILDFSYRFNITRKYIKLCFMGMGEPFLKTINFSVIPRDILRWVFSERFAKGLDGVDYGTSHPYNMDSDVPERIVRLNKVLTDLYPSNPNNKDGRSTVRIFYSLHTAHQGTRDHLMPETALEDAGWMLRLLYDQGINIICHVTLMESINNRREDTINLIEMMQRGLYKGFQLRMLRYNSNGKIFEAKNYLEHWAILKSTLGPWVKFQVSPGKDVNSACGMFGEI